MKTEDRDTTESRATIGSKDTKQGRERDVKLIILALQDYFKIILGEGTK